VTSLSADPDGILLVDKAEGMTSHDVVALTRRKLGTKKIGHCGTLDPIATGLLLLTIGRGTKVQDLLMSEDKDYAGTFVLGVTTNTQDRQGEVIQQRPVPALDEDQIRTAEWLARHSGPVVLSNQATPRIIRLYRKLGFSLKFLNAPRMISCNGDRTPAREVLAIKNF